MKDITESFRKHAIARVLRLMRHDPAWAWNISIMADAACMSSFHFARVFRETTGISPSRFLAALRMECAKILLLKSSQSITEICFDVGYRSVGTFSRLFAELVGTSPTRFRKLSEQLSDGSMEELVVRYFERQRATEVTGYLSGSITGPNEPHSEVFIGIFPSALPQGQPISGTMLQTLGHFSMRLPQIPQEACVLAVALPASKDCTAYLLPSQYSLLVASAPCPPLSNHQRSLNLNLCLRHLTPYDPPIIVALPLLLQSTI